MRNRSRWLAPTAAAALLASACVQDVEPPPPPGGAGSGEAVIVPPGKADDFYSPDAQEYRIEGVTTVTLEPRFAGATESERTKRVRELIALKQVVVSWFLSQYVKEKDTDARHGDPNKNYGGFTSLTKNGSYEDLRIRQVEGETYQFTFRHELGGRLNLLDVMPTSLGEDGKRHFTLVMGKITNEEMARLEINSEWYREEPWENFDPAKVAAERLESVDLSVVPEPRSVDSWIETKKLFRDGELTVSVWFGYDYIAKYHLVQSKETYDWLETRGFTSPVASYEAYGPDAGPFTRTIRAGGREVVVKVWLRWAKPGTAMDPDTDAGGLFMEDLLKDDLATKEVVVYSGHSGPFYGFALANWKKTEEGDLDDDELIGLPLLDGYQIVYVEACNTYGIAQSFWQNPAKAGHENLDVVTTTSFSTSDNAKPVWAFLEGVLGTDPLGNHLATRYTKILENIGTEAGWYETEYGVHGLDDNPHLHPYASTEDLCAPCTSARDCGGAGNVCARLAGDGRICAAECTADDGCPDGYLCADVAVGSTLTTKACVPSDFSCSGGGGPTRERLAINEVGASPADGRSGDWNQDGVRDAEADEFVEIVNPGVVPVKVGGWTISDGSGARFTFPTNTEVPPRGAVLVFGGGAPERARLGGVQVFVAAEGLGLNDTDDQLVLADSRGAQIDRVTWGQEANDGGSLVRVLEGDTASPLAKHPEPLTASPGTHSDGAPF